MNDELQVLTALHREVPTQFVATRHGEIDVADLVDRQILYPDETELRLILDLFYWFEKGIDYMPFVHHLIMELNARVRAIEDHFGTEYRLTPEYLSVLAVSCEAQKHMEEHLET